MKRRFTLLAAVLLAILAGCRSHETGKPLGSVYARIARPVVWRVLPNAQAATLGIQPGDVLLTYNEEPVPTNEDLLQAQARVQPGEAVPLTLLRGDDEVKLMVQPGPLGVVPDAGRYTSSLAVALEDLLEHFGTAPGYDWLAAELGESFTFKASPQGCRSCVPDLLNEGNLTSLRRDFGLSLRPVASVRPADSTGGGVMRDALKSQFARGRAVLVFARWADQPGEQWGIAVRADEDDSMVYGFTLGSAEELPMDGPVSAAFEVRYSVAPEPEPADLVTSALVNALELGQAYSDSACRTGIAAYDVVIGALDSVPFCPACGDASQACFEQLVWSLAGGKESANRFLRDMKMALPDDTELIDEIITDNEVIISKLQGIVQSGVKVGAVENQQKLARTIAEIQIIESDLLAVYEDLIGEL
jgi:hypothetical protein